MPLAGIDEEIIDQAVVGNRLSDISHAVQAHAENLGFSVVKTICKAMV